MQHRREILEGFVASAGTQGWHIALDIIEFQERLPIGIDYDSRVTLIRVHPVCRRFKWPT